MAEQKIYIGSLGPYLYDDTDPIDDPDGDLSGQNYGGMSTTGSGYFGGGLTIKPLKLPDTNDSNTVALYWNEDDTADRILNILVSGADRSLTLSGDSALDQDLTTLSTPTFVDLILSTPTYTMFNLTDPGANSVPQWNTGTSVWEWAVAGITDLSSFTTDDLTEGSTNLYFPGFSDLSTDYGFTDNSAIWNALVSFPGFTDLSTDYGFTDNSSNWDTAFDWGDHSIVGYINDSSFTADGDVLVGTGSGTFAAENGSTLRTSLGLGTTDTPQFTGLNLGTGELTAGSINRASGSLTLEIGGAAEQTITATETTFGGNIVIPNAGYIGSASDTDAIQIEADGDINFSGSNLTINSDLSNVTSKLIFGRTTGGNAEISWDGTNIVHKGYQFYFGNKDFVYNSAGSAFRVNFGTTSGNIASHLQSVDLGGTSVNDLIINEYGGNVVIGTTTFIGTEKLRVNGVGYFDGALTAASYTDNTPWFEGDAISEIIKIKGKDGEIDHESLPEFLRTKKIVYKNKRFVEEFTNGRDIGNNVSMLNVAVMQLYNEIQSLKSQGVKYV